MTNLTIAGNSNSLFYYAQDTLVDTLKQFWETDSIGIKEVSEITKSHDGFNEQVRFNGQRYEVPLPWRDNHPTISSDYELCVNRLKSLQRKLLKEPELIREYNQIIEEQLSKGIVERVAAEKDKWEWRRTLPSTPRRDTKRPRNNQTEDCVRWFSQAPRTYSAFLIVGINETDRDMLLFLWLKDPDDLNSEIAHLRFIRLVFGLRPSPAILASTIQHHLDSQVSEEFKPHFIKLLKKTILLPAKETKRRRWSCVQGPNRSCNGEDSI